MTQMPGQFIVGKERQSEQKLRRSIKKVTSMTGCRTNKLLIFLAPSRVLAFIQPGGPFSPLLFMFLFVLLIHHKSCVQLVCLFALHIWITLTRRSLLD